MHRDHGCSSLRAELGRFADARCLYKKKPDGQGKPSGFLNSAGTRGREGKPALRGGRISSQNVMRRADATFSPAVSRSDATMEETAVVTNITAIRAAIRESVVYIIFVVLSVVRHLLDVVMP